MISAADRGRAAAMAAFSILNEQVNLNNMYRL